MRVLISAFAFSPCRGSEAAVGWNLGLELSKLHEVTLLCGDVRGDERTKNELHDYFTANGNSCPRGLRIEYVGPTRFIAFLEKLHALPGLWCLYYWAYNLWQRRAYVRARELHANRPFDVVHQLNMIGYREPGYLWKLNAPFVWGPVGGGPNEPLAFHKMFSWSGCVKVFLRTFLNEVQKRICLRACKAASVARKIWAVTEADYRMISDVWGVECEKLVETGTVLRESVEPKKWDGAESLKIIWSGIHTSRKALPILLHALAKLKRMGRTFHVDILGEGPETEGWKSLAAQHSLNDYLTWHGRVSHEQALAIMSSGHLFAFPSLKEGTPHVVLEALSLGLPVICHDACGMGIVITEKCGIKVPLVDSQTSVNGFACAVKKIMNNPSLLINMSREALARSQELTWRAKAKVISESYMEIAR